MNDDAGEDADAAGDEASCLAFSADNDGSGIAIGTVSLGKKQYLFEWKLKQSAMQHIVNDLPQMA